MSNVDELARLKELLDNGTLTQEEFEIEKQKLLRIQSANFQPNNRQSVPFNQSDPQQPYTAYHQQPQGQSLLLHIHHISSTNPVGSKCTVEFALELLSDSNEVKLQFYPKFLDNNVVLCLKL